MARQTKTTTTTTNDHADDQHAESDFFSLGEMDCGKIVVFQPVAAKQPRWLGELALPSSWDEVLTWLVAAGIAQPGQTVELLLRKIGADRRKVAGLEFNARIPLGLEGPEPGAVYSGMTGAPVPHVAEVAAAPPMVRELERSLTDLRVEIAALKGGGFNHQAAIGLITAIGPILKPVIQAVLTRPDPMVQGKQLADALTEAHERGAEVALQLAGGAGVDGGEGGGLPGGAPALLQWLETIGVQVDWPKLLGSFAKSTGPPVADVREGAAPGGPVPVPHQDDDPTVDIPYGVAPADAAVSS